MATAKTPKSTPASASKPTSRPAAAPGRGAETDGPARFYGDETPTPDMAPKPPSAGGRTNASRTPKPAGVAKPASKPAAKPKSGAGKGASTSATRSSKSKPTS